MTSKSESPVSGVLQMQNCEMRAIDSASFDLHRIFHARAPIVQLISPLLLEAPSQFNIMVI
jgi:hypothetical protein